MKCNTPDARHSPPVSLWRECLNPDYGVRGPGPGTGRPCLAAIDSATDSGWTPVRSPGDSAHRHDSGQQGLEPKSSSTGRLAVALAHDHSSSSVTGRLSVSRPFAIRHRVTGYCTSDWSSGMKLEHEMGWLNEHVGGGSTSFPPEKSRVP